jgi:hypothetical protein
MIPVALRKTRFGPTPTTLPELPSPSHIAEEKFENFRLLFLAANMGWAATGSYII